MKDELLFEKILTPLHFCAHGTKKENIDSITKNGLQRKNRKHIHFVNREYKFPYWDHRSHRGVARTT